MLIAATSDASPGIAVIQSGIVLAFGLLLGWWVHALIKRLGQPADPFSVDLKRQSWAARLLRSLPRLGGSAWGRHWLASAHAGIRRRWSSAPKAGLALFVLALVTMLPPAYALGSAPSAPATSSSWQEVALAPSAEATPAPSPSDTPLASPSLSPTDTTAQPPAAGPPAPIVGWPTVAPSRPTPPPPPPPPPTPTPTPPNVILTASPLSGLAPLTVLADASRSTSSNGISSYEFDFGNGIVIRPMLGSASASYKYCIGGTYRLKVTVTDKAGLSSSAFVYVQVIKPVNPVIC